MANQYQEMARALLEGKRVIRLTALDGEKMGQASYYLDGMVDGITPPEKPPAVCQTAQGAVLYEVLCQQKALLICGGGHISVPVCRIAKMLGYHVTVMDDRAEFAQPSRFPEADAVLCQNFSQLHCAVDWDARDDFSVVIVTRGHAADTVCLREALRHDLAYLGMIGSRRKNRAVFDLLMQEGVSREQLERVHAPIGLEIGAETPEEIAVSIAAEWIADRQHRANANISQEMLHALAQGKAGIMATVVQKRGSAPRGIGARMFFCEDGRTLGTVGGGLAELEVCHKAEQVRKDKQPVRMAFDLSNGEAGKSGMICGGRIEVLFEVVE